MNTPKCPVCGSIGLPRRVRGKFCQNLWHLDGDEQPKPIPQPEKVQIVELVKEDLDARREVGIKTYGTALTAGNGRDALQDAYEEVLDLCCYLRQVIEERG